MKVTVSSLLFHDPGVVYCISVTESFARIYDDYALRCDYWPEQISISYGGGEVGRNDTPMELCMNGEAHCICYGKVYIVHEIMLLMLIHLCMDCMKKT